MQEDDLKQKINPYLHEYSNKRFLHTTPHHDDTMLAYFPVLQYLILSVQSAHHFATMTSGFNSISDECLEKDLQNLVEVIKQDSTFNLSFDKNFEIKMFMNGVAARDSKIQNQAKTLRMARDILQVYGDCIQPEFSREKILKFLDQAKVDLVISAATSRNKINELKGMIRDWEEEVAWAHLGVTPCDITHMKLSFYASKDEKFDLGQDIQKVVGLLEKVDPDVVTVASEQDPIGHKTHIKVFKIVSQAIKLYLQRHPLKKLNVWEYRNVWCQFEPSEVNLFFPVTMSDFYTLKSVFINSYKSQVKALFPVPGCEMPFCDVMQKIMHEQFQKVRACIGQQYFDKHQNTRVKATQGLCFVISLDAKQFLIKNNLD